MRLLIVLAGLPEPTVNVIVRGEDGSWRMRFDLCYLEQRLIVEYDGRRHADSPEQWERDIYRREDLDRMDYRLLIVTSRGIYNEPHRTLERVRDALLRLLAHRGESAVVVARRGNNASARSSSVRRRAIPYARSLARAGRPGAVAIQE